jgi:hypothetical protein
MAPGKRTLTQAIQRRGLAEGTAAPPQVTAAPGKTADPFDFGYVQRQAKTGGVDPPVLTVRGVALTADAGEKQFRAIEAKLTLAELKALRQTAADGYLGVAAVLGREAVEQGVTLDNATIVAGRAVAEAYVAWVSPQATVEVWTAALADLALQTEPATLPAATIATLRLQVATLPPSLRGTWYQVLHDKAQYDNQRDNTSSLEKSTGGTCNLTSVSMALEGMGYDADPDSLINTVTALYPTKDPATVIEGVGMREAVEETTGDAMTTWRSSDAGVIRQPAFWTDVVRAAMACGHGVFLGARGHVIRVQRVDDDAVVVDDPYGKYGLADGKWDTKNDVTSTGNAGADNRWPFADGALDDLTWVRIIAPRVLTGTELSHHVAITVTDKTHVVMGGARFVID